MGNPFPGTLAQSFHFRWWLWVCALNTGASYSGERVHKMSIQNKCWVKFDSAMCTLHWNNFPKQQWSPQWRRQGTHVGFTWSHWPVTNQHVRARPGAIEPWRACANGSQKDVRVSRSFFSCDQAALWMVFSVRLSVCLSVRLSVCHTFLTMFPSSYHHEIFRNYYQWQKWRPCKRSRSEVKGQGHRGQHTT